VKNLAGNEDCDTFIEQELLRAGIKPVACKRSGGEVDSALEGKLGRFRFHRAWYYWVVIGNMPLAVAEELYRDPVGKTDVRVAGHCGCPPPKEWATWLDEKERRLFPLSEKPAGTSKIVEAILNDPTLRFVKNPSAEGEGFICSYHIDSEVGLRLFADAIKKHNLV